MGGLLNFRERLLNFRKQGDFLRADRADGHARTLGSLEGVDVTSKSFSDQVRASTMLRLSNDVDLFEETRW